MRRFRPRSSAFRRSALPFVLLAAAVPAADEGPSAKDILRKAVEAQGEMPREVSDVTLEFKGEISEQGEVHTVLRSYWYRAADRSFRVRTGSGATDKLTSDRGVFGAGAYWERSSGGVLDLSRGNRDDAAQIKAIERERAEFERMLRMVLLARLDGDAWQVGFAEAAPVRLDKDLPHDLTRTLRDREKETYHVLDLKRDGEPSLRLFVHTGDYSVRKAVEFDAKRQGQVRFVYYFAAYWTDPDLKLLVPRYLSVYRDTPRAEAEREELLAAKGRPAVRLNTGLVDENLRPRGAKE